MNLSSPAATPNPSSQTREVAALLGILLLALALRSWELERLGWGAEYYTAAVRSMTMNWHNFFFVAFDPAGFISIDKPPLAFWLQVLSVKLIGFTPLALLLPQILEGVAAVWVLYRIVRRRFAALPALLAALFVATTPVWVAVNRTNNADTCLLLILLLAAWALMHAAETGRRRTLFLSMALVGLAFNTKMLAAFVVLPGFYLTYLLAAPLQWRRRLGDLAAASLVLAACALPWILAYEATPAENRPYVGSSRQNSMLELVVGHNAAGRFISRTRTPADSNAARPASSEPPSRADRASESRSELARLFVQTPVGPLRLVGGLLGAQIEWLLPLALVALLGLRSGATQFQRREPLAPQTVALLFWLLWCIAYVAVYSALGGIIHYYYLSTLAPALAALAGIGVSGLWERHRQGAAQALWLPALLLLGAGWQLYLQASGVGWPFEVLLEPGEPWLVALHLALVGGIVTAVVLLVVAKFVDMAREPARLIAASALTLGIAALLVLPLAWSLSAVLAPRNGILPSADLRRLIVDSPDAEPVARSRFGPIGENSKLVSFLKANHGGEAFLLATSTVHLASHLIIATGEPVMARGGFHGLDPAINAESLSRMVAEKRLRFAMLGDTPLVSRRMGADAAGKPLAEWVRSHGQLVDPVLWRTQRGRSAAEIYDLRPDTPLLPAPPRDAGARPAP